MQIWNLYIWKVYRIFIGNPILMGFFSVNWLYWKLFGCMLMNFFLSFTISKIDSTERGWKGQNSKNGLFLFFIQFWCGFYFELIVFRPCGSLSTDFPLSLMDYEMNLKEAKKCQILKLYLSYFLVNFNKYLN